MTTDATTPEAIPTTLAEWRVRMRQPMDQAIKKALYDWATADRGKNGIALLLAISDPNQPLPAPEVVNYVVTATADETTAQ